MQQHRLFMTGVVIADASVLVPLRPSAGLLGELADPGAWLARVGPDAAMATLAAAAMWLCAAWVALGLLAAAGRGIPGAGGRVAARISDIVLPRVLQRVLAGSAGVGVLLAPLPALGAGAAPATPAPQMVAAAALPAPVWPSSDSTPTPAPSSRSGSGSTPATYPHPVPAPRWPSTTRPGKSAAPAPRADPTNLPNVRRTRADTTDRTTVRARDCLWLIAAHRLGPHPPDAAIAASWPQWYAANRAAIGADPALIRPGPGAEGTARAPLGGAVMTAALAYPPRPATRPHVVIRPAPRREPPFDDELPGSLTAVGPLDQRLPFAPSPVRGAWRPRPRRSSGIPDPEPWGRRLVIGLIETAAGRRPLHQLSALLSSSVSRGLGADFELAARTGTPHWLHRGTVRSIRASEPAEGIAEISATVDTGPRVRAVAMRLEVHHGRWRCTRLQLG